MNQENVDEIVHLKLIASITSALAQWHTGYVIGNYFYSIWSFRPI